MKRNVYLDLQPLTEAREGWLAAFDWITLVGTEIVPSVDALGRVTSEALLAARSVPDYNGAAMDGFAVRSSDTFAATEENPVEFKLGVDAHPVNTGHPLPAGSGSDAVVMIENAEQTGSGTILLRSAAFPWQHVRRVGEDIVACEMVFPHHHALRPSDVAALIACGVFRVPVLRRPRVAILATGSELLDWRDVQASPPPPGRFVDTNSVFLSGLVREAGGDPIVLPRQPDSFEAIRDAVRSALDSDAHMVIVNAGASAGTEDFTAHVFSELGEVMTHGIAAMPGKPTILGRAIGKPLVGAPGYPVSAWVCFDQVVRPALARMQALPPPGRETVDAVAARKIPSKLGHEEFLRVHLGRVGDRVVATPLKRGAGTITSLTRADGILRIGAHCEGIDEGALASAELFRSREDLGSTLVIVGSHDPSLDLLADHMLRLDPKIRVSASNVGSLAGLIAIRDGRCHMGGTHLLDEDTGGYNRGWIARYLPDTPVDLVTLAWRQQGLMVSPGNPAGLRGIEDLARQDVTFVNRQAGSGTRVLLEYHLRKLGIDHSAIRGWRRDEYTHMAVAVAVLSGSATAGMGVLSAARALGLDFIPVAEERYDLCIPTAHMQDRRVVTLLRAMRSQQFRSALLSMGGYRLD